METFLSILFPIILAIAGILFSLIALDWIVKNYKQPIFIIILIVSFIHILAIYYIPFTWTFDENITSQLDVDLLPAPDTWAGMLFDQDEDFTDDFLYASCENSPENNTVTH